MKSSTMTSTLLGVLLLAGCTQTKFLPPSPDLRAHLGVTGVEAMSAPPALNLGNKPVGGTGSGALLGAGQGASLGLPIAAGGCMSSDELACGLGVLLGAAVAVMAAPIGAVAGALNAHSTEEVALADTNLHAALADAQSTVTGELRNRILAAAQSQPVNRLLAFSSVGSSGVPRAPVAPRVDSRLEITVTALQVAVAGRINPDETIVIAAAGRLARASSDTTLYARSWAYVGPTRNYFKAAQNNAQLLRSDVAAGLNTLAAKIFTDLFVSTTPEIKKSSADAETAYTLSIWAPGPDATPTPQTSSTTTAGQTSSPSERTAPAASAAATASTAPVAVPFRIDIGTKVFEGVGRLEKGHLSGDVSAGGRPINIRGDMDDHGLSLQVDGALNPAASGLSGSYYCSASATRESAVGQIAIPMNATCGVDNRQIIVHLGLPPA